MNTGVPHSCIYSGKVRHRRFTPVEHAFSYQIHLFFLDLDNLHGLFQKTFLWSCDRRNLGWFRRKDYMAPHHESLKALVIREVTTALSLAMEKPRVFLLTNLRQWGLCFNPVSFYYVYDGDTLRAIVAEVNNTPWNERHRYVIPTEPTQKSTRHEFSKAFHVSPFNPLQMRYQWVSSTPAELLSVHMENHLDDSCHMDATLTLERKSWNPTNLNRILLRTPFNTLKVPVAIYWQALKLWFKGAPVYNHSKGEKRSSPVITEEKSCD